MATAAYQYVSDDGTTYQVVLPSDFALALNYQSATGLEPYLPSYISPRFATYQTLTQQTWVSAVIPAPFGIGSPPASVVLNAQTYLLSTSSGEQRNAYVTQNIVSLVGPAGAQGAVGPTGPAGPTGPVGPGGALYNVTGNITTAQMLAIGDTPIELLPSQGAGVSATPVTFNVLAVPGTTKFTQPGDPFLKFWQENSIDVNSPVWNTAGFENSSFVIGSTDSYGPTDNYGIYLTCSGNMTLGDYSFNYSLNYTLDSLGIP